MPNPAASQKGFSLVEVMLAATVLLVGITSMIYALTTGTEMLDAARKSQIAQQVIDGEINRLRVADWGTGPGGIPGTVSYPVDSTPYNILVSLTGVPTGDQLRFALTNFSADPNDDNKALLNLAKGFTVSLEATTPRTEYRVFSYTVQWSSALGKSHTRRGTAFIGKYGLAGSYKR